MEFLPSDFLFFAGRLNLHKKILTPENNRYLELVTPPLLLNFVFLSGIFWNISFGKSITQIGILCTPPL